MCTSGIMYMDEEDLNWFEKNMKEDEIKEISIGVENVQKSIGANTIKKVIFVKDKLINFVI